LKIYKRFRKARQQYEIHFNPSPEKLSHSDTEIELALPIIEEVRDSLDRQYIEKFWRKYAIVTTDISFKFRILVDDNNDRPQEEITAADAKAVNKRPSNFRPAALLEVLSKHN
jgi:hypothetical protein